MKPYKLPTGFLDWKEFEKHLTVFSIVEAEPINLYGKPSVLKNLAYLYQTWARNFPLYCLRQELLEDMLLTDVGEKLELFSDIQLAIPCYALFFPKNKVKAPNGEGYLNYLIIHHQESNLEDYKHFISWGGINSKGGQLLSSKRIRRDGTLVRSHFSSDDKKNQETVLVIRNIVLQSILLLQYYPALVEDVKVAEISKGFGGFKTPKEPEFQLPRWLGQEKQRTTSDNNGQRQSVATHFRRGHWRKLKQQESPIWVRPTWVNSQNSDLS